MEDQGTSKTITVPASTAWPFFAALGVTLIFAGLVTHIAASALGAVILARAAVGWWFDVLPRQKEERARLEAEVAIPRSQAIVAHLQLGQDGHRLRYPTEVHPIWTGLYGGAAGGVAMAVVAVIFGLISQGSIWYPINLLGAGVIPSLANAPLTELKRFSMAGLLTGTLIHGTFSLLVGLLYAVSLPMFPQRAGWRSGLVSPLLWSGLIASALSVINPTLNSRIGWGWFVGSQIAYGITASVVIARTEKIRTFQSLPWAARAGLETRGGEQ
jgi:hypothetical protein